MVVFVMLHLLHPLCQSLQLQSQGGHLLLLVSIIHLPLLPPALLYCDGLVRLNLVVITKQHLESEINIDRILDIHLFIRG